VLSEGSASVWAVCTVCAKRGGRSLRAGWIAALFWLLVPLAGLYALIRLLERIFG
jgi:4-amino-4-deoxy-L-arabinose transferase-like glycosyltransferase